MNRQEIEAEVLARLQPSPDEARHMAAATEDLMHAAQAALDATGIPGQATVQGSVAKGTWLAGSTDVDVFLLIAKHVPETALHEAARSVAKAVLEGAVERYAQHPYVVGTFKGLHVDIVPAYAVEHAMERMSAVDRTPFHTAWAAGSLDEAARQRVRLAKAWCKGVEVYGADTARAGFSGYLLEVLIASLGSFDAFLAWLAADAAPRRFSLAEDRVSEEAPLVVVDPVDPERNCAAAVAAATLQRATHAARAYLQAPSTRFFLPQPARAEDAATLHAALAGRGESWLGLWLPSAAKRLDIVFPQFQKAAARIRAGLAAAGFTVVAQDAWTDDVSVGLQWRLAAGSLPASRVHQGPPADGPHAQRFTQKWQGHPDAVSPVVPADGRLQVEVAVRERTPAAWLAANLDTLPLGKHVQEALARADVHADPADVVSPWAPRVADFILDRRPWQR